MRQFLFFVATICLTAACSKTAENVEPRLPMVEFNATAGNIADDNTRIALEGNESLWEEGDQVAMYVASYGNTTTQQVLNVVDIEENQHVAHLNGNIPQPQSIDSYYTAYPSTTPINSQNAQFTIKAVQTNTEHPRTFEASECLNASMNSVHFTYHNVTSYLHLTGSALAVADKVTISAVGGENIAGSLLYNFDTEDTSFTGASATIEVQNPQYDCYIALPEIELSKGYMITLTRGNDVMMKSVGAKNGAKFVRSKIHNVNLGAFEAASARVDLDNIYTSYNLYKQGKISEANGKNWATIYAGTLPLIFEGGISSTLGANFANLLTAEITLDDQPISCSISGTNIFADAMTNQNMGSHTVKVTIKKDGVVIFSASKVLYITGLPYFANPPKVSNGEWFADEKNKYKEGSDDKGEYIQLGCAAPVGGCGIFRLFYAPENINIAANVTAHIQKQGLDWVYPTFFVEVGGAHISDTKLDSGGIVKKDLNLTNLQGVLTPAGNEYEIKYTEGAAGKYALIYSASLLYR